MKIIQVEEIYPYVGINFTDTINAFLKDNKISKNRLIDIKYTSAIDRNDNDNVITLVLVIYESEIDSE